MLGNGRHAHARALHTLRVQRWLTVKLEKVSGGLHWEGSGPQLTSLVVLLQFPDHEDDCMECSLLGPGSDRYIRTHDACIHDY